MTKQHERTEEGKGRSTRAAPQGAAAGKTKRTAKKRAAPKKTAGPKAKAKALTRPAAAPTQGPSATQEAAQGAAQDNVVQLIPESTAGQAVPEEVVQGPAGQVEPEVDVPALVAERDELKDLVLRARAEFDNYRKRVAREAGRLRQTAAESLMRDLLPVVDSLERALEHAEDGSDGFAQGVEMVFAQMCEILRRNGLEPIAAVGEAFDPNVHEAVMKVESEECPEGRVVQEFQKGYRLGGYVLRPSKVVVSAGLSITPDADAEDIEQPASRE